MPQTTLNHVQPKKVLIIEDEGDICLLLNILLAGKNIDLDHVKNITSAREYLDGQQPDLVMLDNKLPDGLGIDFIGHIRNKYPDIKILMISGYHSAEIRDIAIENGADEFLEKPFTKEQISHSVHNLLDIPVKGKVIA
jgi:two-component system, OmpR family, response regulator